MSWEHLRTLVLQRVNFRQCLNGTLKLETAGSTLLNQDHIWLFCAAHVLQHCKQSGTTTNHLAGVFFWGGFFLPLMLTEKQEWLQIEDKQAAVSTS